MYPGVGGDKHSRPETPTRLRVATDVYVAGETTRTRARRSRRLRRNRVIFF